MRSRGWLVLSLFLAVGLLLGVACGDDDDDDGEATEVAGDDDGGGPAEEDLSGESVDVLGLWGAEEITKFEAMYGPWTEATGADVSFVGDRDINTTLTTRVEGGEPPDMALPASLGIFRDFASSGDLTPLSECLEEGDLAAYPQSAIDVGTVDGELYGILMKAGNKGTMWYSPAAFDAAGYEVPTTFDEMLALADQIVADGGTPFSDAEEAGGGTGFPGSDWIQQIFLNMHGPALYDRWVSGDLPYSSDESREAWELFGQVLLTEGYLVGGPETALATPFAQGSVPLFTGDYPAQPDAYMHYLGSFNAGFIVDPANGFPEGLEAGVDYDYFPFPTIGDNAPGVTGDANIMMIFNSDPKTCSLLRWLATGEAQQIWVALGGFTSFSTDVDVAAYPTDLERKAAEQLANPETVFRFDADDAMPTGVGAAVFAGVIAYLQGGDLDEILQSIEATFP
ncbi:MAG: ABC transporter substrate-binding protein [Dehalococcoidia bacterium]